MLRIVLATALAVLAITPARAEITGTAEVVTPERISINGQRILLHGIDGIERDQPCFLDRQVFDCYAVSKRQLEILVSLGPVTCEDLGPARFGYVIGRCHAGDVDIAEQMVRTGNALAFRMVSEDYVAAEEAAKAELIGLWRAEFIEPWEWRMSKNRPEDDP